MGPAFRPQSPTCRPRVRLRNPAREPPGHRPQEEVEQDRHEREYQNDQQDTGRVEKRVSGEHHVAEAGAGSHEFGRDVETPACGGGDTQSGQQVGEDGRHDHRPIYVKTRRARRQRSLDVDVRHIPDRFGRLDRHDHEYPEGDQQDLGSHADAEPQDEHGDRGEERHRADGVQSELERVTHPAAIAEGQPDADAGDEPQCKP